MTRSSLSRMVCAFAGAALILSTSGAAIAGPMTFAGKGAIASPSLVTDVRARVRARRGSSSAVPGAVLGLFGAALGAAVAGNRYDNYSYYSYGYPNGYGYSPGYGGSPAYGYGHSGWGGRRGWGG